MSPVFPKEGTRAHAEFMMRARDPNSIEAKMVQQMIGDAANQTQQVVRDMLQKMIELVPGQLFRDIGRFHEKFQLPPTTDPGHRLPDDVLAFRIKFLMEELSEYAEAVGHPIVESDGDGHTTMEVHDRFDAEKAFDALIDLAYVCLGTAYLHRFPFNEGWDRVQEANMAKVRADSHDDPRSVRKHKTDVVKPEGWKAPVLADLLEEKCLMCNGTGEDICCMHAGERPKCEICGGTGRRKRGGTQEAPTA